MSHNSASENKEFKEQQSYFRVQRKSATSAQTDGRITTSGWQVIPLCTVVHFSSVRFPYFTVAIYIFSYCTFFIMHQFNVALSFVLHSFYVMLYFMLHFYTLPIFSFWILLLQQFFPVTLCSSCNISIGVARTPTNIFDGELCNNNKQSR